MTPPRQIGIIDKHFIHKRRTGKTVCLGIFEEYEHFTDNTATIRIPFLFWFRTYRIKRDLRNMKWYLGERL